VFYIMGHVGGLSKLCHKCVPCMRLMLKDPLVPVLYSALFDTECSDEATTISQGHVKGYVEEQCSLCYQNYKLPTHFMYL
jgi:hypothetical protein